MTAFATMKAIVKTCTQNGMHLTVPINGTMGEELRISLDNNDQLSVQRMRYEPTTDTFEPSGRSFDEKNTDDKYTMTHDFLVDINTAINAV